jgi:hypothetical protein
MTTPPATDRRDQWSTILLAVAIVVVVGSVVFFAIREVVGPSRLELAGRRVQIGMTLAEVEAILGPGTLINGVPHYAGDEPVVRGDVFYEWTATQLYGERFIVAFKDRVVFNKWYHNLNYF